MSTMSGHAGGMARPVRETHHSKIGRVLFGSVTASLVWLVIRLYLGYEWVHAALDKLGNPAWTGAKAGTALQGFVAAAIKKSAGQHASVQSWYASFLQHAVLPHAALWSYFVSFGELLVGVALIIGLFTGIAAFAGAFMNVNYLMAGTVSTNPILLILAILVVVAWKTAGWIGLDRLVLPRLGTPWSPGSLFRKDEGGAGRARRAPVG